MDDFGLAVDEGRHEVNLLLDWRLEGFVRVHDQQLSLFLLFRNGVQAEGRELTDWRLDCWFVFLLGDLLEFLVG